MKNFIAYDLWELTRTDNIANNYELYKIFDVKKIASIIRKHIKPRFPMCKFSIRSTYNSIYIDILESPFEKNSEELKSIVHYVYTFAQSYNYDNCDIMSDYVDVNFYGVYENSIVSSSYKQTESTENIKSMIDTFKTKKAEHDKAEAIRKEKETQERIKQLEIERQQAAEWEKQIKINKEAIEDGAVVCDCEKPYYILDMQSPHLNKFSSIEEAETEIKNGEFKSETCKVVREVYMSEEIYTMFKDMLLTDFSFLTGMGGTATIDNRINSMIDYTEMTKEEQETVTFYADECVAIYCNNTLMLVCNPEGFNYARYILIPEESYTTTDNFGITQILSDDEAQKNLEIADGLYDKSADIIMLNNLKNEWNGTKFDEWRRLMTKYIVENKIDFDVSIVRAIPEDAIEFKTAMYRLLKETDRVDYQFSNTEFTDGQHITVFGLDDCLGGVHTSKVIFKRYEVVNAWNGKVQIKLIFKVPKKRGEYYRILKDECLIVDGWVDIPDSLFWEESISSTGLVCRKSRYLSFDRKQFDVILDYFDDAGIRPTINTYKPQFN
jgi:hypothetical protein